MEAAMSVIVNPVAANGAVGKWWPQIRDTLRAEGGQFDASFTEAPNHATELAREALSVGYRTIVAVGGPVETTKFSIPWYS